MSMRSIRCVYVIYDIQDNSTRYDLANILIFYGLHRVQYSVFSGLISPEDKRNMLREIESLGLGVEDKVYVFDLCRRCVEGMVVIGKVDRGRGHLIF